MAYGIDALNSAPDKSFPKALLVPYWMRTLIRSNSFTAKDLIDPKVLMKYLAYEDLSDFINVQSILAPIIDTVNIVDIFRASKDPKVVEHISQVHLTPNNNVHDRFTESIEQSPTCKDYEICQLDDEVFLIYLEPSFLNAFEYRDKVLTFISDCLKIYYAYVSLSQVSHTQLFKAYLDLLNPRIPFRSYRNGYAT
jgi:hypothetical protein